MRSIVSRNPTLLRAIVLGALGGVALILTSAYSTRGPLIYVPYAALLAALAALVVRQPHFSARFAAILAGFMTASLVLYVYIGAFGGSPASSVSLFGHTWRLAFLLSVGAVLSLAISYIAGGPRPHNNELVSAAE